MCSWSAGVSVGLCGRWDARRTPPTPLASPGLQWPAENPPPSRHQIRNTFLSTLSLFFFFFFFLSITKFLIKNRFDVRNCEDEVCWACLFVFAPTDVVTVWCVFYVLLDKIQHCQRALIVVGSTSSLIIWLPALLVRISCGDKPVKGSDD